MTWFNLVSICECSDLDIIGRHSVALYLCLLNNGKLVLAVCFAPDCCDCQVLLVSLQNFFYAFFWFQYFLVTLHDMQVLVVVVQVLSCCYLCDIASSFVFPNSLPSHSWVTLWRYWCSATWSCGPGPDSLQQHWGWPSCFRSHTGEITQFHNMLCALHDCLDHIVSA